MTLTTETARMDYAGTGTTGPFSYTFRIFNALDLDVTRRSGEVETTLVYPTDYTVTGVRNRSGGTVTLTTALAVGETLTIRRAMAVIQETDLRNLGPFLPENYEDALDKLVMIDQMQQDMLDRSMRYPVSVDPDSVSTELPVPAALQILGWNAAGTALENQILGATTDVALPANGRTVTTLTAYLANNAVFNVKDYGATGNGATVDTVAMHAARDAAAAAGGVVYFPAATYITDPDTLLLRFNKSNVSYKGWGATIKRKTGSTATDVCFWGDPALTITNTGIDGLTFDGNRANTTPSGSGVVLFGKNLDGFRISNLEVKNGAFFGFHLQGCVNGTVGQIYTHHHNRDACTWSDGCAHIAIGQVVSKYSGDDGLAFVYTSVAVHDITVDSYISYNSGYNSDGTGSGGYGIKFSGDVHHIVVNGLLVNASADAGVGFEAGGGLFPSYCTVQGRITAAGRRAGAANKNALLVSGGTNIRATLDINGSASDGVLVNSGATDIHLDVTSDSNVGAGAKFDGTGARLGRIFAKVRARNNAYNGGLAVAVDRLELTDPVCTDNATAGGAGALQTSGFNVQDITTLRVIGGDTSQLNTGATNKQAYGFSVTGTACVDVTMVGHTAKVAVANQNIYVQTLPTGDYRIAECEGLTVSGYATDRMQKSAVGSFIWHGYGNGAPAIACAPGSTYRRLDGGVSTILYVKSSAIDASGWVSVANIDGTGSLSPTTGTFKIGGTQVLGARSTGWSVMAGTATKGGFDTATVTLPQLAQVVKAIVDAFIAHGALGA